MEDDYDNADSDVSCPASAGVHDYARMLQACETFTFRELTPEETCAMPDPPEIYKGACELKRRVAYSFDTPLGAVQ